ncbi:hypothetical protein JCM10212_006140 [Sporobolomyces blumeae]
MHDATEATQLYTQLDQEWSKGDQANSQLVSSLLTQLKVQLAELGLLFPTSSSLEPGPLSTARRVLEIGALHSIRSSDTAAFERYLSLLATYYHDRAVADRLERSHVEPCVTALSLLRFLSQNRIAEFHTALETLQPAIVESNEVAWVLQLERSLMEGSYSRVWSLCRSTTSSGSSSSSSSPLPLAEFSHFTSTLVETVRNEIAACDEKAYESLPVRDAQTLLFFDSEDDVKAFAKQRNWYLDPSTSLVHFPTSPLHPSHLPLSTTGVPALMATGTSLGTSSAATATQGGGGGGGGGDDDRELDRNKVVRATLAYAKELESIV